MTAAEQRGVGTVEAGAGQRPGVAWQGEARQGEAEAWLGRARPGRVGRGWARRGLAGRGRAGPGKARRGSAGQGVVPHKKQSAPGVQGRGLINQDTRKVHQ